VQAEPADLRAGEPRHHRLRSWPGGFQGQVSVANGGTTPTTGWTVTLTFANGQKITQIWNARTGQTAGPYTIVNESHNGAIAAGGTATFGFLGSWSGANPAPTLTCARTP
ncbi:cellulose binding domain-containing protein, partial [Nonomuraea sp. RK-328]|nr:cellulose binding domain-containing protein [Nonomuraea sp. RK-328]